MVKKVSWCDKCGKEGRNQDCTCPCHLDDVGIQQGPESEDAALMVLLRICEDMVRRKDYKAVPMDPRAMLTILSRVFRPDDVGFKRVLAALTVLLHVKHGGEIKITHEAIGRTYLELGPRPDVVIEETTGPLGMIRISVVKKK